METHHRIQCLYVLFFFPVLFFYNLFSGLKFIYLYSFFSLIYTVYSIYIYILVFIVPRFILTHTVVTHSRVGGMLCAAPLPTPPPPVINLEAPSLSPNYKWRLVIAYQGTRFSGFLFLIFPSFFSVFFIMKLIILNPLIIMIDLEPCNVMMMVIFIRIISIRATV